MPQFPDGFQEALLWNDPAEINPANYHGAVLRAEEIRWYVIQHNLLIDTTEFRPENLKGASYTMSPHATEGWIITDRGQHQALARKADSRGAYYVVPRNSLVYIRLRETLRLPFYIIGRHNLKIDYVYQGLLLGTGPQVDPGYTGRIYIPLHNLTNQQVNVYIEESFVSIDFVRTGPLQLDNGQPASFDEFYAMYGDAKRPINLAKLDQKVNLHAYLQGATPSSSLGELVPRVEKIAAELRRRQRIEIGVLIAVVAFLVTLLTTYFLHFDRQLSSKTDEAFKLVHALQKGVNDEISSVRSEAGAQLAEDIKARSESVEKQLEATRRDIATLQQELRSLRPSQPAPLSSPTPGQRPR